MDAKLKDAHSIRYLEEKLQEHWVPDAKKSTPRNKIPATFSFHIDSLTPAPMEWQVRELVNEESDEFLKLLSSILARPWIPRHGTSSWPFVVICRPACR